MERTKLIVGNWKMHTSLAEAYTLARGVLHGVEHIERIVTVLCPPTIWLTELAHEVLPPHRLPHLKLGAQNMYYERTGPFTGETSPAMLKEVAEYVIIGHSDRTRRFHEDYDMVAKKVEAAFDNGLIPVLCVGEEKQQEGSARTVVQLLNHLIKSLPTPYIKRLVVAYEPVWAISGGGGGAATPEYAGTVIAALRTAVARETRILYGGSATEKNAAGFLQLPECDGLLVGGASLKLKPFLQICQYADDLAQTQGYSSLHA